MTQSIKLITSLFICIFFISACSQPETTATTSSTKEQSAEVKADAKESTDSMPMSLIPWKEGEHYKVISDEVTAEPEVVEYFSFWCPHCYNFEPLVNNINDRLDSNTDFKKVHVNFMRFTTPEIQDFATLGMAIGRHLNQEKMVNAAIFQHIHEKNLEIKSLNDVKAILIAYDVTEEDFESALKSDEVKEIMQNNNASIDQYREILQSVPNFIVNGKYQATFTRDMTADDVVELIYWLSKQN